MPAAAPPSATSCGLRIPAVLPHATPEWWGLSPRMSPAEGPVAPPASPISKDVLRSMCQPFVEQMLQRMQDGVTTSLTTKPMLSPPAMPTTGIVSPSSTPELWGVCPSYIEVVSPAASLIPTDVLRSMCLPFIEQMLQNVQEGITSYLQQVANGNDFVVDTQMQECGNTDAFGSLFGDLPTVEHKLKLRSDLGVTEPSLPEPRTMPPGVLGLAPHSTSTVVRQVDRKDGQTQRQRAPAMVWADEEPETSTSKPERSAMVCRHWKSKGFCRLGGSCKFLHPEQKRGPGLVIELADGSSDSRSSRYRRSGKRRNKEPASAEHSSILASRLS